MVVMIGVLLFVGCLKFGPLDLKSLSLPVEGAEGVSGLHGQILDELIHFTTALSCDI